MAVHVLTLVVDARLPQARSLKDKRAVVRSLVEGAHRRHGVAAAETDHQDVHQRAQLAFVAVSGSPSRAAEVIDEVERLVWSKVELEVLDATRHWLDTD